MQNKPYTLVFIFKAKTGKEEELRQTLQNLIAPTLSEEGCIAYQLHQSLDNPSEFMFYESWMNPEAHEKHGQTPHIPNPPEDANYASVSF